MLPVKEERHLIKILRSNIREKRRRRRQKNIQFSVVLCGGGNEVTAWLIFPGWRVVIFEAQKRRRRNFRIFYNAFSLSEFVWETGRCSSFSINLVSRETIWFKTLVHLCRLPSGRIWTRNIYRVCGEKKNKNKKARGVVRENKCAGRWWNLAQNSPIFNHNWIYEEFVMRQMWIMEEIYIILSQNCWTSYFILRRRRILGVMCS